MGLFERKKHRREDMAMVRRVVESDADTPWHFISAHVWEIIVFFLLTAAIVAICFGGRQVHLPVIFKGFTPKMRFEADFDFSYKSEYRKELKRAEARMNTHVYRVAFDESEPVLESYRRLIAEVTEKYDTLSKASRFARIGVCREIVQRNGIPGISDRAGESLARIVDLTGNAESFARAMSDSLQVLEALLKNGVYEERTGNEWNLSAARGATGRQQPISIAARELENGEETIAARESVRSGDQRSLKFALLEVFRSGLIPNLLLDREATEKRQAEVAKSVPDVIVNVKAGEALLEPDIPISDFALERWNAYKRKLQETEGGIGYGLTRAFTENIVVSFLIMTIAALYARVCVPKTPRRRRNITLLATMILINLGLVRLALDLGEMPSVVRQFSSSDVLFWIAPPALAAIILVTLTGPYQAMLGAFVVSAFATMMIGRNVEAFFALMLACFVGVVFARQIRNRSGLLKAGFFSGVAIAAAILFARIISEDGQWEQALWQAAGCLLSGLFTGILAVGLLPILEYIFKITTNVTLLELTDYNHPLLRKLQFIAPGTFHHSVMVANLAERAASEIGANALLCRAGALYHDIGKLVKPEYFVENQSSGNNPHTEITPAMSALIIKSHVREGVEIAKEYALPRPIIEIIEQHHGTGLIQYFYHKAKQAAATAGTPATDVDAKTFRYDGPRPRNKETAIVMFADSIEAASRSLKKITPQTIDELVETIAGERVADDQLDLCPLTMNEVMHIRESLKASILNMLHNRIEYPGQKQTAAPDPAGNAAPDANNPNKQ